MSELTHKIAEVLWEAFDEQVCVDRSLNRICDTGDHDFDMGKVADRIETELHKNGIYLVPGAPFDVAYPGGTVVKY